MARAHHRRAAMAAALLWITACGSDGAETDPTTPIGATELAVVVDTDMALDDILALTYLAVHPDVDLLAVTVSGTGEVVCPIGATNALRVLAAAGVTDVPVACGPKAPLTGQREFPLTWRTAASRAYDLALPDAASPARTDAVRLLVDTISSSKVPVTLVTLGPLTNVALALAEEPSLTDHLARIVMMGGAVAVDGNVVPEFSDTLLPAEWNFYIDPAADAAVMAAGVPMTLVALDATNEVPMTQDITYLLAGNEGTPAVALVQEALANFVPPYLWDPLAAVAAAAPSLVPTQDMHIAVDTDGDDAGRTVEDPAGTLVQVATAPDGSAVVEHWVRTLAGLTADQPTGEPVLPELVGEIHFAFDGAACTTTAPTTMAAGVARVTVEEADGILYVGIVSHIADGFTWDESLAYAMDHPGEQPPMIDDYDLVAPAATEGMLTSPAMVELQPGTYGLVCGTPDGSYYGGSSFTVTD